MHGPWYTLIEAAQKLKILPSELNHEIQNGNIHPALLLQGEALLYISKHSKKGWIGHASFTYTGHVMYSAKNIAALFDGADFNLAMTPGLILEPQKIKHWQSEYFGKSQLPQPPLIEWQDRDYTDIDHEKIHAVPRPQEIIPTSDLISSMAGLLVAKGATSNVQNVLDTKTKLTAPKVIISPDQVRISATEIARFCTAPKTPAIGKSEGNRENQLHSLIETIIVKSPTIEAKEIWRVLEQEVESDTPIYDKSGILISVNDNALEWISRHNNTQELKWTSFRQTVSRVRSRLKN